MDAQKLAEMQREAMLLASRGGIIAAWNKGRTELVTSKRSSPPEVIAMIAESGTLFLQEAGGNFCTYDTPEYLRARAPFLDRNGTPPSSGQNGNTARREEAEPAEKREAASEDGAGQPAHPKDPAPQSALPPRQAEEVQPSEPGGEENAAEDGGEKPAAEDADSTADPGASAQDCAEAEGESDKDDAERETDQKRREEEKRAKEAAEEAAAAGFAAGADRQREINSLPLPEAALEYAARGLPVIPLEANTKKPALRGKFSKTASTDPNQIRRWWKKWPKANIGLANGELVLTLDVDIKNGAKGRESLDEKIKEYGPLPKSPHSRTPSGGDQYFFRGGKQFRNTASQLAPGIDTRGNGGLTVLPPSTIDGRAYQWVIEPGPIAELPAPPRWIAAAKESKQQEASQTNKKTPMARPESDVAAAAALLAQHAPAEGRNGYFLAIVGAEVRAGRTQEEAYDVLFRVYADESLYCAQADSARVKAEVEATFARDRAGKDYTSFKTVRAIIGDVADEIAKKLCWNTQAHETAVAYGFELREDGVYYLDPKGKTGPFRICDRLEVVARTRSHKGERYGRMVRWIDEDGCPQTAIIPSGDLLTSRDEVIRQLSHRGLWILSGPGKPDLVVSYIQNTRPAKAVRSVSRLGWNGDSFVFPEEVIAPRADGESDDVEEIHLERSPGVEHYSRTSGTLAEWQENVGRLALGNSRLVFAISTALAALAIEPLGAEIVGVHFFGLTSTGKTTIAIAAGSVAGGGGPRGFVRSWRSTANALENIAEIHNSQPLIQDELHQIDPNDVALAVYSLSAGDNKARLKRDSTIMAPRFWQFAWVSTGEIVLAEHVASLSRQKRIRGGASVRLLDIPVDAGRGMGAFEDLHGVASAADFAKLLKANALRFYGQPLRALARFAVSNIDAFRARCRELIAAFIKSHRPTEASAEVDRALDHFALVAAVGEVAGEAQITGWPPGAATSASAACFAAWLDRRGGTAASDPAQGVAVLRRELSLHGQGYFLERMQPTKSAPGRSPEFDTPIPRPLLPNHWGYTDETRSGKVFFIWPEIFRDVILKEFDHRKVCEELQRRGHIIATEPERWTMQVRVPDLDNCRKDFYCIPISILEGQSVSEAEDEAERRKQRFAKKADPLNDRPR